MAFAFGIGLAYYFDFSVYYLLLVLSILLVAVLICRYFKFAFATRHLFLMLGFTLCGFIVIQKAENRLDAIPESFELQNFKVLKLIEENEKWDKYSIQSKSYANGLLYLPSANNNLEVGASFSSNIKAYKNKESKLPQRFNYYQYLRSKKINYTAFAQKNNLIHLTKSPSFDFRYFIQKVQISIASKIDLLLEGKAIKGLFSAILLGDKSNLDEETQSSFSNLGISHFLAVSGLHVGIIYILLSLLLGLKKFKRHRFLWGKIVLVLSVIWFYALISGFSLSVSRAAFMFSCFLVGRGIKRDGNSFNILCFCAFVSLCFNPYVFTDVGFQLSYAAVASIVLLFPKMQALLSFKYKWLNFLWDAICVTCCAQLGTMPIIIYTFGFFPAWFLLSNIWLSIFSFILTISAFLFVPLAYIPYLSNAYVLLADGIYRAFLFGVNAISTLPFTKVFVFLEAKQLIILLLMLFAWFLWLFNKRNSILYFALISASFFMIIPNNSPNNDGKLNVIQQGNQVFYSYSEGSNKWLFPKYYNSAFDAGYVKNNADNSLFRNKYRLPEEIRPIKYGEIVILHIVNEVGENRSVILSEDKDITVPNIH